MGHLLRRRLNGLTYSEGEAAVKKVLVRYPEDREFRLRGQGKQRFRVSHFYSYYSESAGGVQLVLERYVSERGEWLQFGRFSAFEVESMLVEV